jgi:hypothetical protein
VWKKCFCGLRSVVPAVDRSLWVLVLMYLAARHWMFAWRGPSIAQTCARVFNSPSGIPMVSPSVSQGFGCEAAGIHPSFFGNEE